MPLQESSFLFELSGNGQRTPMGIFHKNSNWAYRWKENLNHFNATKYYIAAEVCSYQIINILFSIRFEKEKSKMWLAALHFILLTITPM